MSNIIQIITAFVGSLGFGILYNIRGHRLFIVGAGGMVGWIAYLYAYHASSDKIISAFIATLVVVLLSEILARIIRTPATTLLVPMLIPLVPGGDLFYATSHLVLNEINKFQDYLSLVTKEAAAIASGIILMTCIIQIVQHLFSSRKTS